MVGMSFLFDILCQCCFVAWTARHGLIYEVGCLLVLTTPGAEALDQRLLGFFNSVVVGHCE